MRATLSLFLLLAAPAAAQQAAPPPPSTYTRAIAAGYKALTLCNAIFAAGRTEAQTAAQELHGIYPEYDAIVPTLAADVDREERSVAVAFDPGLPPRSAAWERTDGCQLQPIGSEGAAYMHEEPAPPIPVPASPKPWPYGDGAIRPRPSPPLAAAADRAFDGVYGAGSVTTGVVVLQDGRIVAERYAPGWGPLVPNRTWSVAKSIAGTLVGLARLDPSLPAPISEWRDAADPRAAITTDQLLRMASGLHTDAAGNRSDAIYFGGTAVTDQAPGLSLEAKPGTRFRYSNADILLATYALRTSLGRSDGLEFPKDLLFEPLGMRHTQAGIDWRRNYILSSQVWSTARDLARLGQFWLQDGVWQGRRLLPEGWMRYMTTPSGPQPASGPGYGATMWLFGPAQGLPAGSYAAQGNRGQYVMVVPARRLVIVRRGEDPGAARFDIARFAADVAAALEGARRR